MKTSSIILIGLITLAILGSLPIANAQLGVGSQTSVSDCRSFTVSNTINAIATGSIVLCSRVPSMIANSAAGFRLGVTLTTPQLTGTSPSLTLTLNGLNGCTSGTAVTTGTSASASWGAQTSTTWMMTMAGASCTGYFRAQVSSGGNTIFDEVLDFSLMSADNPAYIVNSGTIANTLSGTINSVNSGTIANTLSGTIALTESGTEVIPVDSNTPQVHIINGVTFVGPPSLIKIPYIESQTSATMPGTTYAMLAPNIVTGGSTFSATIDTSTNQGTCTGSTGNNPFSRVSSSGYDGQSWAAASTDVTATFADDGALSCTFRAMVTASTASGGYASTMFIWRIIRDIPSNLLSGDLTINDDSNGWQTVICGYDSSAGTCTQPPNSELTLNGNLTLTSGNVSSGNTTIQPAYQDSEEYQKAQWMIIIFILLVAIAEWRKDAIYHLVAGIAGALTLSGFQETLGLSRIIILAVVIYQFWRLYKVVSTNRNTINGNPET